MPIDPSLITDTLSRWQTPQFAVPDPLVQYARLQALKNGMVQQQVQQQELQSGALDLQQKQQTIGAQKALGDAIQSSIGKGPDGTPTIDHNAVVSKLSASPYAYTVPKYMEGVTAKLEADAKLKAAQLDNATKGLDLATREFSTATDQPSWDQAIAHAQGLGVDTAKMGIPPAYSDQAKTAVLNLGMSVKDQLAQKSAADTAAARVKTADVAGDKLGDERIERALNAAAGATDQPTLDAARNQALKLGASAAQVNAIPMRFDPDSMAAYTQSRLNPEQRTTAAQRQADAAALATNRAAELAQGRQRIGISAAEQAIRQKTFDQTYGPNAANLGLAGVPPHLVPAAASAATKAGEEYATATRAADAMNTVLDLTAKGNKAAGSNLPLVGVETLNALNGIKRINGAEISQYGTAGSLLDQIKGKIGKLATGDPIPADVLGDIREMHRQLATGSVDQYRNKLQVINQTYGSKFQPATFAAPGGVATPASGAPTPHVIELNGKHYQYKGSGATSDLSNYLEVK